MLFTYIRKKGQMTMEHKISVHFKKCDHEPRPYR